MTGHALVFSCPECGDTLTPQNIILSDHRSLVIACTCAKCQTPIYFDMDLIWLSRQMGKFTHQKLLPMSKDFTLKDIAELRRMGIADEQKGDQMNQKN